MTRNIESITVLEEKSMEMGGIYWYTYSEAILMR
jgi:hypothetical protein